MAENTLRLSRRQFAELAGAGALVGAAGCLSDPEAAEDDDETMYDHVVVAQVDEPTTMNPYYDGLTRAHLNLHLHMYDHLLRRDPDDYSVAPGLAEEWEQVDDETWQLTLREGVQFHNGDELTAAEVRGSFDLMHDESYSPGLASHIGTGTVVEEVGEYELEFTFDSLDIAATFPERLTTYPVIVHPDEFAEKDDGLIDDEGVSGTGPFEFQEWDRGNSVTFEANEDWWRGTPKIETLTWEFIEESSTRVSALQTGELDVATAIPEGRAGEIDDDPDLTTTDEPSVRVRWCVFNREDTPFEHRAVRQAANYAVDVETIVEETREGFGAGIGQPIPDYFFGYNEDVDPYPYDPDEAERLLDEAGYPDGFETTFTVDQGNSELAQAVAGYLRDVGIDADVEVGDAATLVGDFLEGNMAPMYYQDWGNWSLFHAGGTYPYTVYSDGEWSYVENDRADELIEQTFETADRDELESIYRELGQETHDEAEFLYLFTYVDIHGKRSELEEFRAHATNLVYFDFVV